MSPFWRPRPTPTDRKILEKIETDRAEIFWQKKLENRLQIYVDVGAKSTRVSLSDNVPAHEDFVTVLVCGENLRSDSRVSKFDDVVFHRDIETRISPYPDLVDLRVTQTAPSL